MKKWQVDERHKLSVMHVLNKTINDTNVFSLNKGHQLVFTHSVWIHFQNDFIK